MPYPNQKELQLRPPLRTQGPRPPQACHRGACPRRILVSLGGLLIVAAEPTPLRRSLDVPAWGATPRRSVSDYDKEEKSRAFGYFLTWHNDPHFGYLVKWLDGL